MVIKSYIRLSFIFVILIISKISKSQNIFLDEINSLNSKRDFDLNDSINKSKGSYLIRSTSTFQNQYNKQKNKFNLIYNYDFINNTLLPENWNDGIMYPSRGWQERHTIGASLKFKFIDINYQPELLKVQNLQQEYYPGNPEDGNFMPKYFGSVANVIDNYRQFGSQLIDTMSLGQSRLGFIFNPLSFGISNENFWWGPGKRNSLIFTNNSGGFNHYYLNTIKPICTNIGEFEFSAISGILDTNWYQDPDISLMKTIWSGGIAKKNLDQRKIDAFTLNWKIKWIPDLYIGYAYSRQYYKNQLNQFGDKYTFFSKDFYKQELGSIMFRLLFPKESAELYGEMGIQGNSPWPWKFFETNLRPGYVFGFTKNSKLFNSKYFLSLNFEATQLQLMNPKDLFYPDFPFVGGLFNSWYTDLRIKQGYTNQGQILGSSIGPGSNMQSITFTLNRNLSKFGFQIERIEQNKDFMYIVYYNGRNGQFINGGQKWGYYNKYWVDISTKLFFQIQPITNIFIAGSVMNTDAYNYRWIKFVERGKKYDESSSLTDKFNVQFQLSLKFLLNAKTQ